jgi:ATP:cob(I)alamin adenosyltransferase
MSHSNRITAQAQIATNLAPCKRSIAHYADFTRQVLLLHSSRHRTTNSNTQKAQHTQLLKKARSCVGCEDLMIRAVRALKKTAMSTTSSPQLALGLSLAAGGFLFALRRSLSSAQSSHDFSLADIAERRKSTKVKKSILYTGTGDKGASSLYNGERRSKQDATFEALGATDELNAAIGVAREHCLRADNGLAGMLTEVQSRLLDVGAAIATPRDRSSEAKLAYTVFPARCTKEIEYAIDELDSKVSQSLLHEVHATLQARSTARRIEYILADRCECVL